MGRRRKMYARENYSHQAARAGVHVPSERGTTMKPGKAVGPRSPKPSRGVSAKEPPIHPSLCAMSPPASDHPQDSGVYWEHSQQYGEGWAGGAKIIGKSGNYFVVEVWGNTYRMKPCKSTRK